MSCSPVRHAVIAIASLTLGVNPLLYCLLRRAHTVSHDIVLTIHAYKSIETTLIAPALPASPAPVGEAASLLTNME
jgi:hypothetical protein